MDSTDLDETLWKRIETNLMLSPINTRLALVFSSREAAIAWLLAPNQHLHGFYPVTFIYFGLYSPVMEALDEFEAEQRSLELKRWLLRIEEKYGR